MGRKGPPTIQGGLNRQGPPTIQGAWVDQVDRIPPPSGVHGWAGRPRPPPHHPGRRVGGTTTVPHHPGLGRCTEPCEPGSDSLRPSLSQPGSFPGQSPAGSCIVAPPDPIGCLGTFRLICMLPASPAVLRAFLFTSLQSGTARPPLQQALRQPAPPGGEGGAGGGQAGCRPGGAPARVMAARSVGATLCSQQLASWPRGACSGGSR